MLLTMLVFLAISSAYSFCYAITDMPLDQTFSHTDKVEARQVALDLQAFVVPKWVQEGALSAVGAGRGPFSFSWSISEVAESNSPLCCIQVTFYDDVVVVEEASC